MLYKEYLSVEADFIPVFSSGADTAQPELWKSFYPHENFKQLLTLTLDTLEKGSAQKDRSIWLSGTYGTGKTYASFVIKHLLEDDLEEVERYCRQYEMLGLYDRLVGIRSLGKILVVHQSSSSGIDTQNKLFNMIIESVKGELRAKGYRYTGTASMFEKVLSSLKDSDAAFNFQAAFRKYREKFLEYESAREVIEDLETLQGAEQLNLLEVVVEVAESESYNWSQSAQDVIARLRDLRIKNNLRAIFFIWDEFTEYFRNNLNNITGLQEIVQQSSASSFYFLLITHLSAGQLFQDDVQRKILEARFKTISLLLAPKCAFSLLAHVLTVKTDLLPEWEKISGELRTKVHGCFSFLKRFLNRVNSLTAEDFALLLPIHPYSALLLKFITQAISSDQRTMFNFLCSEQIGSFKQFIDTRGFEYGGDNFLTADSLWDFFFHPDNPDLDDSFLEIMSCFDNYSPLCTQDIQLRILKTALLLCALQRKSYVGRMEGATALLRATLKNISACYSGTSLESEVRPTMDYFAEHGFFSALEESEDTFYLLSAGLFNSDRLEKIQEQMNQTISFDSIVKDENAFDKFIPTDYLKNRLVIRIGTPTSVLGIGDGKYFIAANQILLFILFAGSEEEQAKVDKATKKIMEANSARCLVADFTATPLTKQRREKIIFNKAREKYFSEIPNQAGQARLARRQAESLVEEWINQLCVTQVRILNSASPDPQFVLGEINFLKSLHEQNRIFFPFGAEEISVNDRLFSSNGLTESIAKIGLGQERAKGNYAWLNFIGDSFRDLYSRGGRLYWEQIPTHPISKMKNIVEEYITKSLAQSQEVKFSGIWNRLKEAPTGLLKCAGSIFLLSLLLKDYVDKNLYIKVSTGQTSRLTEDLLSYLIVNAVKESAEDKILVRQTAQQVKLSWLLTELFGQQLKDIYSVDEAVLSIKAHLSSVRVPFCLLRYFVEEKYSASPFKADSLRLLKLLWELLNENDGANSTRELIFSTLEPNAELVAQMKDILQEQNFTAGLKILCSRYKVEEEDLFTRLNLGLTDYIEMLAAKTAVKESYSWTQEEVTKCMGALKEELLLVDSLNGLLSAPQKKLSAARQALKDKLNRIRLPRALIEEFHSQLSPLFKVLILLTRNEIRNYSQATNSIKSATPPFLDFFEHQFDTFKTAITRYVEALPPEQSVEKLFSTADGGYFFKTRDDFVLDMKKLLEGFRLNEQNAAFLSSWRTLTDSTSPSDWSKKNSLPILCMFQDCLDQAQQYFTALNDKRSLSSKQLSGGIDFLHGEQIRRLANKEECARSFVSFFCGENYSVLVDADSLRNLLRRTLGNDVYAWFAKKQNCEVQISKLAEKRYRENILPVVRELIRQMSALDAQKYLLELIERDTLLGIRVLKNSEKEVIP